VNPPIPGTPAPALPGTTLHEIFAARARTFGNRIAISEHERTLSYAELDRDSTRLACALVRKGVKPGDLVGLYLERGIDKIVGLLGILKAGAAYVPIDPAYPEQRIRFILEDSRLSFVVSATGPAPLPATGIRTVPVNVDEGRADLPAVDGSAACYVIYTSGSTGTPKGVLVEHRNVVRLFEQTQAWFDFGEHDVWTLFHSIGFDFSVWEIWGALLHGGRLVAVPYEISRSPADFHALLVREGVTILNQTPSAFTHLERADRASGAPLALRQIIFGGEELKLASLAPWVERHGDHRPALVNMYGITETTVHVTYRRLGADDIASGGSSPIGRPIPDLAIHLLDEHGHPVADGVPGEIHVEGAGLTRGYLHRPDLTAQRFVLALRPGTQELVRMYRTGDRAVRTCDGDYLYRGRIDDQLKVRGFRIEPKEIELCLARSALVGACHVGTHDYGEGDVRLVAYVVPASGVGPSAWNDQAEAELRRLAAAQLPDYMRPSAYVPLAALPTTAHGKIDKRALPPPQDAAPADKLAAPAADGEEAYILHVWNDSLGLKGIGLRDDFFDHGGTSLALIHSLTLLKKHYNVDIKPSVLVKGATAERLATAIRAARHTTPPLETQHAC
jgi:syringomycin synthetase protein SyrB1